MSPRTAEVNAARREQSRARILDAALALFSERGYSGTSLGAITERAGVSSGLANYYFPTKRDLLIALLTPILEATCSIITKAPEDPDRALASIIDTTLGGARTARPQQAMLLAMMIQPGIRDAYAQAEREKAELVCAAENRLCEIFRARGADDPQAEQILLRSTLEGVAFKYCVYGTSYPLEAIRRRLYAAYELPAPTRALFEDPNPIQLRADA